MEVSRFYAGHLHFVPVSHDARTADGDTVGYGMRSDGYFLPIFVVSRGEMPNDADRAGRRLGCSGPSCATTGPRRHCRRRTWPADPRAPRRDQQEVPDPLIGLITGIVNGAVMGLLSLTPLFRSPAGVSRLARRNAGIQFGAEIVYMAFLDGPAGIDSVMLPMPGFTRIRDTSRRCLCLTGWW